jgi:hypothetical protein
MSQLVPWVPWKKRSDSVVWDSGTGGLWDALVAVWDDGTPVWDNGSQFWDDFGTIWDYTMAEWDSGNEVWDDASQLWDGLAAAVWDDGTPVWDALAVTPGWDLTAGTWFVLGQPLKWRM